MKSRLAAASVAVTLVLAGFAAGVVQAGAPGQTSLPHPCRPGWYEPEHPGCPPRPSGSPSASPSSRPQPTTGGVGVFPGPVPSVSLVPTPQKAPALLPDTSSN